MSDDYIGRLTVEVTIRVREAKAVGRELIDVSQRETVEPVEEEIDSAISHQVAAVAERVGRQTQDLFGDADEGETANGSVDPSQN